MSWEVGNVWGSLNTAEVYFEREVMPTTFFPCPALSPR